MDLEQFLAELESSGERSQFAVDWARAQAKMGTHLGLEARDYACHFAQLACLLGASEIQLSNSGDWLEWSCDGRPLDLSKMQATAAGELLMAELDLCLNFCLQSAVLTDYAEKLFCSGGWQLIHQGSAGWKLRQTNTTGTRLQLKRAWTSRVKNFLRAPSTIPELDTLAPRLEGSHLKLVTSLPLSKSRASCIVRVQGQAPLSKQPPMSAGEVVRFEYPELEGSFWLYFQGHDCQIFSRGLGYQVTPFLPGRIWLSLGEPGTDLGHRQLVLNAEFHRARAQMLQQLSAHFGEWLEDKKLRRFGVTEWLLNCLLAVSDLEKGLFRDALNALPLIPTQAHGLVSVLDIDNEVPLRGCRIIPEACPEEFEEKPFLIVSDRPLLVDFMRRRYRSVQSGNEVLERLRQRQERQKVWSLDQGLDLNKLRDYPFSWPLELTGWKGGIGYEPELEVSRLECYRDGRLLLKVSQPSGLLPGFYVLADHPELEPDEDWLTPLPGPHWDELQMHLRRNQTLWLAEAVRKLPVDQRAGLVWRALDNDYVDPAPLMQVPLAENSALTPERWLADGRRGDLRDWAEEQGSSFSSMRNFLVKWVGREVAERAFQIGARYAAHLRVLKLQPEESMKLPGEPLVQLETPFPMLLGLGLEEGAQFRLYREGRLFSKPVLDASSGLPDGLLVAAQSNELRLTLEEIQFDYASPGFLALLEAVRQALPQLLTSALESAETRLRPVALAGLELLPVADWPQQAVLFTRLDGRAVSLEQARQADSPRVLVGAAARVPLPGFEDCWWLTPKDRGWVERLLGLALVDLTRDYNESYRENRYETGEAQEVEPLPDWSHPQIFGQGSLKAQAGLVAGPGPAHSCETTFCRGGRAAMRCPLVLSSARPREAPRKLVCRVDWGDLPFVENYTQLRALPEVTALIEWLRLYAFEPPLNCSDFQVARLDLELPEDWADSSDATIVRMVEAPIWNGLNLRDLRDCQEILWGEEPEAPLCLSSASLAAMQRLLPGTEWRHWREPSPDQAIKQALLTQKPRRPTLSDEHTYFSQNRSSEWAWGVCWSLSGLSQVRVLYQGRPAGVLHLEWDVEVEAEIDLADVHLTRTGELRMIGELPRSLEKLWAEIQSALLREKVRAQRLRLALFWLSNAKVPSWASPLLESDHLADWWAQYSPPRPFVLEPTNLDGVPHLPAALAGWAEQQGIALLNCTDYARRLSAAAENLRPASDFHTEGTGYYLSTSREARLALVRNVSEGRILEEKEHRHFPPYYLERQYDRWRPPAPLPPRLFQRLWKWWRQQLEADPRTLGWLAELELEKAAPGAEELLELARRAVAAWQDLQQDEWTLLRRSLQIINPQPLRLILCDQGPLLKLSGAGVRLNRKLAGAPGRHTTLRLLNQLCLELPEARSIPWVLHQLK
ncbi:hypothetical protein JST97_29955 [bacterium]|nr:hypothetical protein [bacterium]